MAHQPSRPFESLEWYRDAVRNNFRDDAPQPALARWAGGMGMLHAHVCLFAAGVVVLFLVNLIRSPGDIWAAPWIMAWTVLLLIHAVVIGLLWAIRLWNDDAPDEALLMAPAREREQPPPSSWSMRDADTRDAQEVDFRVAAARRQEVLVQRADGHAENGWTAWTASDAAVEPPPSERASWKEASAAAWLERKRPANGEHRTPDGTPDA